METLKETLKKSGLLDTVNKNLSKEFNEAMKNDDFKELVSKLNISKDVLEKYTSLLEKSSVEYSNCMKCKNILECKNKLCGYAYLPTISKNSIVFNYRACKFQKKILKQDAILKNITVYQTPKCLLEANIKEIYTTDTTRFKAIEWVYNFIKNYPEVTKGLYLHGSFGCGKSFIISALLVELAKKNIRSTIIFWPEFLRDLKNHFGYDNDLENIIYQVKNTPILFIDDIGAENNTVWGRDEILSTILDYRMNNNCITMFTSNLTIKDLESHFSRTKDGTDILKARRIMERIKQMTEDIELISKNLRN
ncbi:MAG: primosomal protein DnaI [Bacilli bacterium]